MASKVSIKTVLNSPQAVDDSFAALEDLISYLDVLDNDGGGSSATLYALLGTGLTAAQIADALQAPVRTDYLTGLGAKASIITTGENAGTISYDASALDYLAEGQVVTDTFSYVIQLGNGTFSIATVTVTVTGTNDRPTVGDFTIGADAGIVEDGLAYRGSFAGEDVDSDDDPTSLIYQIISPPQPGEGTVMIDPGNSAGFIFDPGVDFQDLEEGETYTVTFTYQAVDRHGSVSEPGTVTITIIGTADSTDGASIDGYISNALVFRDSNNNNAWDHETFTDVNGNGIFDAGDTFIDENSNGVFTSEYFAITDGHGNFTDLGGTGRIVMSPVVGTAGNLTTDISTGTAWDGRYSAPAGSTVVTPLTTLLDSLAGPNASEQDIADAMALLAGALGIDTSVNLQTFDPIAAVAGETDPAALALAVEVQKIAVQVANIIAVIDKTLQAAGVEDGGALAAAALAAQVEASGGTTDLTGATLIQTVIEEAAAGTSAQAAVEGQSAAIAEALSGINEAIDAVDEAGDPLGALAEVVAAQIVAQENLATEAAGAVTGGDPVDTNAYEGTSLVAQLDQAANEVETIIPEEDTGSPLVAPERPVVDDGARVNAAENADGIVVTVTFDASAGLAENDKLNLLLNGAVIATYTLTAADIAASGPLVQNFNVFAATLGADGAKVLTSQFETQAGEFGPASLPALVSVDTVAPGAPAAITAVEGTIITSLEKADGTQFTGTVDAGSIVTFTFQNGVQAVVKEAAVTDTSFTLTLTATEIASLGEGYVSYSAIASDAAGNQSGPSATGQFFYTTLPVVDGMDRIDGAGSYFADDLDDEYIDVTALPDGGFSVAWLTDADEDGDGEGFAIQNYLADGSKDGAPVVLQGLSTNLTERGDLVTDFDVTSLDGGRHVLAYAMELEERSYVGMLGSNGGAFVITGRPVEVAIISAPAGVTYYINGVGNDGLLRTQQVGVVDGMLQIDQAVLDQFAFDNRLTITTTGSIPGQVSIFVTAAEDVTYDLGSELRDVSWSGTVNAQGFGGITGLDGRPEAFRIDSLPGTPTSIQLLIWPAEGVAGISLTGVANAQAFPPLLIRIADPDLGADGFYHIPQEVLDQIGDGDMRATLWIGGLPAGTTVTGTVSMRDSIAAPEGVYVQTFDADGNATSAGDTAISSLPFIAEDEDYIPLDASTLSDGGFAVHWLTDIDGDREGDTMAVQRFDASGAAVGSTVLLQGLASNLLDNGENLELLDVAALDGGGFAMSYSLERDTGSKAMNFVGNAAGMISVGIGGVPTVIHIGQAPANAFFRLTGFDAQGNPITSDLLPVIDGQITISQEVICEFPHPNRVSLQVSGLTTGQTANLFVEIEQSVRYDTANGLSLEGLVGNVVAAAVPGLNIGVLGTAEGRVEGFHFAAPVTFTATAGLPKQFQVYLNLPFDPNSISLAGVVGTGGVTAAIINAQGQIQLTFTNVGQTDFAVPPSILAQIGERDYGAYMLVVGLASGQTTISASADVRVSIAVPEGVFVQTFDADGVATSAGNTRIDGDGSWLPQSEDEDHLDLAPLAGGGLAVTWLADTDEDGEADAPAIQRFDASGNAVGDVVLLEPFPSFIQTEFISGFEVGSLSDGSFAITYAMELENHTKFVPLTAAPDGTRSYGLSGRPREIDVSSIPPGATFALYGFNGTAFQAIPVMPVNGVINVDPEILDQFALDSALVLQIANMAPGQNFVLTITAQEDRTYDQASGTVTEYEVTHTVAPNGFGFIAWVGMVEQFQVQSTSGSPTGALLRFNLPDPYAINLTGTGATLAPDGAIELVVPVAADGNYIVPQFMLDLMEGHQSGVTLRLAGLTPGSTIGSTVSTRINDLNPEGVYVQTFDANGDPILPDLSLESVSNNDVLVGDFGSDVITGLGAAMNVMTGNEGSDSFVFTQSAIGFNSVTDFEPGSDVIDLSGIDAVFGTPDDEAFLFLGTDGFTGVAGQARYDVTAEGVTLLLDSNGDALADYAINMLGLTVLDPEDLVL